MSEQLLSTKTSSRPARSGPAESRQKRATTGPGSDRARPASAGSEFPDSIGAHRNVLAGLWAGKLLGLSGEDLTGYANSQRFLCMSETRLASMLENDLRRGGVAISRDEIRAALIRCHRVALHQTCATD